MQLSSRAIEHFGSHGFSHARLARGECQVSYVELDGVIGGHDAASRPAAPRRRGEAVEWQEGEWHETRSLQQSRLILVEGAFE